MRSLAAILMIPLIAVSTVIFLALKAVFFTIGTAGWAVSWLSMWCFAQVVATAEALAKWFCKVAEVPVEES